MRLTHLRTGWMMTTKELFRNRMAIILLFVIPTLFYALIVLTTTDRLIAFKLASISEATFVQVSERSEALIFIGTAAVGLLTSFLALSLVQKHTEANRRLVLCGYQPSEVLVSKINVLLCVIILVGLYVSALLLFFFRPQRWALVVIGFMLAGYVYGCYGLFVGALLKRELEGILFIVLLANIDAGWLQNPIYYADAQNQQIIRCLPAYFPSQAAMVSAFTDGSVLAPIAGSVAYGSALLVAALLIYFWRMRIRKYAR